MLTYNQVKQKYEALQQRTAALERSLRARTRSEVKYRLLVENAPVHLLIIDTDGHILFGTLDSPGRLCPQIAGQSIFKFIPPGYRKNIRRNFEIIEKTGKKARFVAPLTCAGVDSLHEWRVAPMAVAGKIVSFCISVGKIAAASKAAASSEATRGSTDGENPSAPNHLKTPVAICSHCKKIRGKEGQWEMIEAYLLTCGHSNLSHGVCPDCMKTQYPYLTQPMKAAL